MGAVHNIVFQHPVALRFHWFIMYAVHNATFINWLNLLHNTMLSMSMFGNCFERRNSDHYKYFPWMFIHASHWCTRQGNPSAKNYMRSAGTTALRLFVTWINGLLAVPWGDRTWGNDGFWLYGMVQHFPEHGPQLILVTWGWALQCNILISLWASRHHSFDDCTKVSESADPWKLALGNWVAAQWSCWGGTSKY
jgi:hypothetical protein